MKQTAMKYFGIVAIAMMLAPAASRAQQSLVVDTPFVHDPVMAYENGKYTATKRLADIATCKIPKCRKLT